MMSLAVPEFTLLALPSGFPLRAPAGSHARAKKVSFVAAGNFHFPPLAAAGGKFGCIVYSNFVPF